MRKKQREKQKEKAKGYKNIYQNVTDKTAYTVHAFMITQFPLTVHAHDNICRKNVNTTSLRKDTNIMYMHTCTGRRIMHTSSNTCRRERLTCMVIGIIDIVIYCARVCIVRHDTPKRERKRGDRREK